MTGEQSVIFLIVSWVVVTGLAGYVRASETRRSGRFYATLFAIGAIIAILAYYCYYTYYLPYY